MAASTGGSFIRHVGARIRGLRKGGEGRIKGGIGRKGGEGEADRKSHFGSASSLGSLHSVRNLSRFTHHISPLTEHGGPPSTRGMGGRLRRSYIGAKGSGWIKAKLDSIWGKVDINCSCWHSERAGNLSTN